MAASSARFSLRGIVLGSRNVGESHRVVDLFAERMGRQELWARGSRASRKRFVGSLEPFATICVEALHQRGRLLAEQASVIDARPKLRHSLVGLGRASALCRLVSLLWPLEQAFDPLGHGLAVALDHLEAGRLARAAGLYPRLLAWAGLTSLAPSCCLCGAHDLGRLARAVQAAGPVCLDCRPEAEPLEGSLVEALAGARVEDDVLALQLEQLCLGFASWHIGRPLTVFHAQRQTSWSRSSGR